MNKKEIHKSIKDSIQEISMDAIIRYHIKEPVIQSPPIRVLLKGDPKELRVLDNNPGWSIGFWVRDYTQTLIRKR